MKSFRVTLVLATVQAVLFLASTAASQSQDDLKDLRRKKLSKSWLKKASWLTDYDRAKKQAEQQGKIIFAYFTRSYAR